MHTTTVILLVLALSSCTSQPLTHPQGNHLAANSQVCKQLRSESFALFRNAKPTDETKFHSQDFPMGYVSVTDGERNTARERFSSTCESSSDYRKRTSLDLDISKHQ